jgi:DNA-binding NtrC family response regulator
MMLEQDSKDGTTRYRVLVVDDDAVVLDVAAAVLSLEMDVVTCAEAREALRRVDAEDFHVVCADYLMPDMRGDELLAQVARSKPHVGRVLVTGSDAYAESEQGGEYFVVLKPFHPEKLLAVVRQMARVAEKKRASEGAGPAGAGGSAS